MLSEPRCLQNPLVWQSQAEITDHQANAAYIRTLLSSESSCFHCTTNHASLLRNHTPCTVDRTKCSGGGYSISIPIVFEDGEYWLLRITCPLAPNRWNWTCDSDAVTARMIESSVITMEYVRNHTTIPVPRVHFFDSRCNNPLKTPFIVMDFIDGVPIPFSDLDSENETQASKIYKQLCQISYQLSNLRFDKIGGISTASNSQLVLGPKFWARAQYGPITDPHKYYKSLTTQYWNNAASSITSLSLPDTWTWQTSSPSEKDLFTAYLHLQCFRLLHSEELAAQFCLQHHDFKLRNFLVDGETVVGLFDWDKCATVPLAGYDPVAFAREDDEERCVLHSFRQRRGKIGEMGRLGGSIGRGWGSWRGLWTLRGRVIEFGLRRRFLRNCMMGVGRLVMSLSGTVCERPWNLRLLLVREIIFDQI